MTRSLPSRIVAGVLAAALVALSPGLEAYRVFALGNAFGSGVQVPVRTWAGPLNTAFGNMNLASPGPQLGPAAVHTFLRHLGGIDFHAPSKDERDAVAAVVARLQEKGLSPDRFRALPPKEQERALADAVGAVAQQVRSDSEDVLDAVADPKLGGYELRQAQARLRTLSTSGLYFLDTADQHRVLQAKSVADQRVRAQATEGRMQRTAARLGNGVAGETGSGPIAAARAAIDRWKLKRLENPKQASTLTLFERIQALKTEVTDEKSLWTAVDGALDTYNRQLDTAELAWKLRADPGRREQAQRLLKEVKSSLSEFAYAAGEAKARVPVAQPMASRYARETWVKDTDYRNNPRLSDGRYEHQVLVQETGDVAGLKAIRQRIDGIEIAMAVSPEGNKPGNGNNKGFSTLGMIVAVAATSLIATSALAATSSGVPLPAVPGLAGQFLAWLNATFGHEVVVVLKGALGLAATMWGMNKATDITRYLLSRSQKSDLTRLQRNLIVSGVGMAVLAVGLGKTMVLMGMDWMSVGKIFAGGSLVTVGLPLLTSMFAKGGATGGATQAFANQFSGILMGFGLDTPFKEGDTITVEMDGKTVEGVVEDIGISRTRILKADGQREYLSNAALLDLKRIGIKAADPEKKAGNNILPDPKEAVKAAQKDARTVVSFFKAHSGALSLAAGVAAGAGAVAMYPALAPSAALAGALILSILAHEAAHLWALRKLGDDTAARVGVTSANPLRQVSPLGTVLVPLLSLFVSGAIGLPVVLGWAKPVPVDFNKLPDTKRDAAKVAAAGPLVNLAFAALAGLAILPTLAFFGEGPAVFMIALAKMNAALFAFNLLPIHGLDGGKMRVGLMSDPNYDKFTHNPDLPEEYQSTFQKLYKGPAAPLSKLSKLHIHGQGPVNALVHAIAMGAWAAVSFAAFHYLGLPLLFLVLPCSYDYYCIREKIQNEQAVKEIRDIMRGMASALAKAAEEDESVKSEVDAFEVEHILKNAFEDLIDQVVDSEGFSELDDAQKWEKFRAQYMDVAVKALKDSPKGMPQDDEATIRRLLESQAGQEFFAKIKSWIDKNEVWNKWKSPKRKGKGLGEAVKKDKEHGAGNGIAPESAEPAKAKTFEEALEDASLNLSDKEKAFLLMSLSDMTKEQKPPVIGRVDEMDQLVTTITSPRGVINSVVLVGKAGVGKTAVAEKLAQAMARSGSQAGDGTFTLKKVQGRWLLKLDVETFIAQNDEPAKAMSLLLKLLSRFNDGDKRKGNKIVLFMDEVHEMFSSPKAVGMPGLLKQPLRDGEITIVAATTDKEYKEYMENDDAFRRRLIKIDLNEASIPETMRALQGTRGYYEGLYELAISPEALKAAAELSKYDQEVFLPGRAFKYLTQAASQAGFDVQRDRLSLRIQDAMSDLQYVMGELSTHLSKKSLITQDLKEEEPTAIELYNQLVDLSRKLVELYRKRDAVPTSGKPVLTEELVKEEIARKTGVATGQLTMGKEPMEKYLQMEEIIGKRVAGQKDAIHAIAETVRNSKAGINDPNRPLGVFYLTGPTGTGKTHLAKELARFLFDDPNAVIRIDMTEYSESHAKSRMIGSPPGYVGHDKGGQLTEAVRKKPYSVILFDEIEKAHPDVWDILLQLTDDGRLTDGQGRTVDFKNTIILMTSNLGMNAVDVEPYEKEYRDLKLQLSMAKNDAERAVLEAKKKELTERLARETKEKATEITEKAFKEVYRPEFQGRLHAPPLVFDRISPDMADQIVDLNLKQLSGILGYAGHELTWNTEVTSFLSHEGFSIALGARPLKNAIERLVTKPIAGEILKSAVANGGKVQPSAIRLSVVDGAVKITVEALPPKVVARKDTEEGAGRELFTRVLEEVLDKAAKGTVPDLGVETLDQWVVSTLKPAATPEVSPLPTGEVARSAGEGPSKPFFVANEALEVRADPTTSSNGDARAKDPALLAAKKEVASAVAAKRGAEDAALVESWFKYFSTQAKEQAQAPVQVRWSAGEESIRVVIHRAGAVSEKEAEVLQRHFTGPVPESSERSFSKVETWNVMGKPGKEHWLELYRQLSAIPGARLGYATSEAGTDYWIEFPAKKDSPSPSPLPKGEGDTGSPLPTGEVARSAGEGSPALNKISSEFTMGERDLKVSFDPAISNEAAEEILRAHDLSSGSHYRHGGDDAEFTLGVSVVNPFTAKEKALELSRNPSVVKVTLHPDSMQALLIAQGVDRTEAAVRAKVHGGKKVGATKLRILFGPGMSKEGAEYLLTQAGVEADDISFQQRDSGRSNDWTRWAEVSATTADHVIDLAREIAPKDGILEIRVNSVTATRMSEPPTGPPGQDGLQASARPAPGTDTVSEAGPAALQGSIPDDSRAADLRSQIRQLLLAMMRQGAERGPTLRMSLAEALAAVSTPEDLVLARDWVRFDSMDRHFADVTAAALILARYGRRADDEPRLRRMMKFLNAQYGHQYNPAKGLVAEAYGSMQKTTAAGARKLLKKYRDEKDRSHSAPRGDEEQVMVRNDLVIEGMYQALARYGDESAWETLKQDWNDKRDAALYGFVKREKPGVLKKLYKDWKRTGQLPSGAEKKLTLNAIADLGSAEDLAALKRIVLGEDGESIDDFHGEYAAQVYARMVARLGAYEQVKEEVRQVLTAVDFNETEGLGKAVWAASVMAAAGGADDLPVLERLLQVNPENIHYYHEISQHAVVLAWASIVDRLDRVPQLLQEREGNAELPKLMEMLSDRNAVVNKAAVEALKLYFAKRTAGPSRSPRPTGEVARRDGVGTSDSPQQPDHAFFARQESVPTDNVSTYYGTDAEIDVNSRHELDRLTERVKQMGQGWSEQFAALLRQLLDVEFSREVRVVTAPSGKVSVYWVLKEAVTSEFSAGQADRVRDAVLRLLHTMDAPDRDADSARRDLLRQLQSVLGARMGMDYDAGRLYDGSRGVLELWLKADVPATGTAPQATPQQPSNPRFRYPHAHFGDPYYWDEIHGHGRFN